MKSYPKQPSEIVIKYTREGTPDRSSTLELTLTQYLTHFGQAHGCFMTIFMEP